MTGQTISDSIFLDPLASSQLCITLLHSVWQVTLLAVLAGVLERFTPCRSVERKYVVYVLALILGLAALPITYAVVNAPRAHVAVRNAVDTNLHSSNPTPAHTVNSASPARSGSDALSDPDRFPSWPESARPVRAAKIVHESSQSWLYLAPWIATAYVAGVAIMLARLMGGMWHVHRLAVRAEPIEGGVLIEMLNTLAQKWTLRIVPALACAQQIIIPKVVGLARPIILMPAAALNGLSTDQLEMILAHEIAHVRRYDMWVNLLQRLGEAALFFNPALWYLSRRISTLREYCCDELACRAMCASSDQQTTRYASALLQVVELGTVPTRDTRRRIVLDRENLAALAASGRSPSELRRRIARLFGEPLREPLRVSRGGLLLMAILATSFFAGPAVWRSAAEIDPSKSAELAEGNDPGWQRVQLTVPYGGIAGAVVDVASGKLITPLQDVVRKDPDDPRKNDFNVDPEKWQTWVAEQKNGDFFNDLDCGLGLCALQGARLVTLSATTWEEVEAISDEQLLGRLARQEVNQAINAAAAEGFFAVLTQDGDLATGHVVSIDADRQYEMVIELRRNGVVERDGQQESPRMLKFPTDRTTGVVHSRPADASGYGYGDDWYGGWQPLGPAHGNVRVPSGHHVRLDVSKAASTDLGFLKRIEPSAIQYVDLEGTDVTDDQLEHVGRLTGLRFLGLEETRITDRGFKYLANLKEVERLDLSAFAVHREGFGVGDGAMEVVETLPALESIALRLTKVTDAGMAKLATCQSLRSIGIEGTSVTDLGLKHLRAMPNLAALSLGVYDEGTNVTDTGMKTVGQMANLRHLGLSGTPITNEGLSYLSVLNHLESLRVDETQVTNSGLRHLAGLSSLKKIRANNLADGAISNEGAKHLAHVPSLVRIVGELELTDEGVEEIAKLPNLESLHLDGDGERITNKAIQQLTTMKQLKRLTLEDCDISSAALQYLTELTTLEDLAISRRGLDAEGLEYLQALTSLRILRLRFGNGQDEGQRLKVSLEPLSAMKQLSYLTLDTDGIELTDPQAISQLSNLETLNLRRGLIVDDNTIAFLSALPSLTYLDIDSSVVTDQGLSALSGMDKLEYLTISCLATDEGLQSLQGLKSLHNLQIASPYVTDGGLARLSAAMPSLQEVNQFTYRLNGSRVTPSAKDAFWREGSPDERVAKDELEDKLPPPLFVKDWINTEGMDRSLASLRGRVVLVDFWGTWCGPCRAKLPVLKELYAKYKDEGLEIVGVHTTKSADSVGEFVAQESIPWPIAVDIAQQTTSAWCVDSYPDYYLVDRKGNLRTADISDADLETAVVALLAEDIGDNVATNDITPETRLEMPIVIAKHAMLLYGKEIITWEGLDAMIGALADPSLAYPQFYFTNGTHEDGVYDWAKERIWELHRRFQLKGHSEGSLLPRIGVVYDRIKGPTDLIPDENLRIEGKVVDRDGKSVRDAEVLLITPVAESISYKTYPVTLIKGRVRNRLQQVMTDSDEGGRFVLYPPSDKNWYIVAMHPDVGFGLVQNDPFSNGDEVRLFSWANQISEIDEEPGRKQTTSLSTRIPERDGRPEVEFNQYWSDSEDQQQTNVFDFTHVPPFHQTTISRHFELDEGGSVGVSAASVSLLPGETRRLGLGKLTDQQRAELERTEQMFQSRRQRVRGKGESTTSETDEVADDDIEEK